MKNYERMARDVLQRVKKEEEMHCQRIRYVLGTVSVACTAILLLAGIFLYGNSRSPLVAGSGDVPTAGEWVSTSVMKKVYLSERGKQELPVEIAQGIRYQLQAVDLRGLTEEQIQTVFEKQRRLIASEQARWSDQGVCLRGSVQRRDNVLLSSLATTGFSLDVPDWQKVSRVEGICSSGYGQVEFALYVPDRAGQDIPYTLLTENGKTDAQKPVYDTGRCWLHGPGVALAGDYCQEGGIAIMWKPGSALLEALDNEPTMPLSAFSDTLIITVYYEDNTVEKHTVRIHFSDDGVVDALYEGVARGE